MNKIVKIVWVFYQYKSALKCAKIRVLEVKGEVGKATTLTSRYSREVSIVRYKVKQIRGKWVKYLMNRMHSNGKRFNTVTPAWDYWFQMECGK